jgi:molybdenum cofactor cytidylyltransferase
VLALASTCAAVLFLPVDQPFVPPLLLQRLIAAWQAGARIAACSVEGTVRGAPAIFDRILFPDLLRLEGDVGARSLLQQHRTELVVLPAQAHDLRDIDTPDDLAAV